MKLLSFPVFVSVFLFCWSSASAQTTKTETRTATSVTCNRPTGGLRNDVMRFQGPLEDAITTSNVECLKDWIANNRLVYPSSLAADYRSIAVIHAVIRGNTEILDLILRANADTEVRDKDFKYTALLWVACTISSDPFPVEVDLGLIDVLIRHGADLDTRTPAGENAVICNAELGRLEYLESVLRRKASINAQNSKGQTALMLAVDEPRVLALLKESNVFMRDDNGRTAAFYAIEKCQPNKLRLLLNAHKDIGEIADEKGIFPFEFERYGVEKPCEDVVKIVKELAIRK